MDQGKTARCISCRSEISVPDSYGEGSQIGCGTCSTQLRVVRAGGLRLVIADPLALRETLREVKQSIDQAERELQTARASWGIGVNGLGIGVFYVVTRMALEDWHLNRALITKGVVIALVVGILLELANTLFLAKRQAISRLTAQLQLANAEKKELERKIRESSRR